MCVKTCLPPSAQYNDHAHLLLHCSTCFNAFVNMTPQKTNKNLYTSTHTRGVETTAHLLRNHNLCASVCIVCMCVCVCASLLLLLLLYHLPALVTRHIRVLFLSHCLLLLPLVVAIVRVFLPLFFSFFLTASLRLCF